MPGSHVNHMQRRQKSLALATGKFSENWRVNYSIQEKNPVSPQPTISLFNPYRPLQKALLMLSDSAAGQAVTTRPKHVLVALEESGLDLHMQVYRSRLEN